MVLCAAARCSMLQYGKWGSNKVQLRSLQPAWLCTSESSLCTVVCAMCSCAIRCAVLYIGLRYLRKYNATGKLGHGNIFQHSMAARELHCLKR